MKYENLISQCSDRCRKRIKNNKNYQQDVSVCTTQCKINNLKSLLSILKSLRGRGYPSKNINSQITNTIMRLENENKKFVRYKMNLRKRQATIPVDLSLRPNKDRTDLSKIN